MTDAPQKAPFWRSIWFWGAVAGFALVTGVRPLLRHVPPAPPARGRLPDLDLVDQRGRRVTSADLRGRVHIVSFIDTACGARCAPAVRALRRLATELRRMAVPARMISISRAPARDTPTRLAAWARAEKLPLDRWRLLTGRPAVVEGILGDLARAAAHGDGGTVDLATTVFIADGDGGLRGSYPATRKGVYEVFHRVQHVLALRRAWRR